MRLANLSTTLLAAGALALGACGGGHDHDHGHGHDHGDDHGAGGHAHTARYGGTLVELGDHLAHVELVLDAEAGTLRLYSLDAHAEQPVRLPDAGIEVVVEHPDGPVTLTLAPVASELTGETVGDSSEFAVTDERLLGLAGLAARIPVLETRGQRFEDVRVPAPSADAE